jgi:hypothetical protein
LESSKKILCPYCGRYVSTGLFYTLHYFKICLEPLPFEAEVEAEDCGGEGGGGEGGQA